MSIFSLTYLFYTFKIYKGYDVNVSIFSLICSKLSTNICNILLVSVVSSMGSTILRHNEGTVFEDTLVSTFSLT